MGANATKNASLIDPFGPMNEWTNKNVAKVLTDYKTQDLDFGLDAHGLSLILDGARDWSEKIVDKFGSSNGLINALAFITGASLVVKGSAKEKSELIFDALDFDETGKISMDEMTILFLCALRGVVVMTGLGIEPTDDPMESITVEAYKHFGKSNSQSITKEEFIEWIDIFLGGNMDSCSIRDVLEKFGLYNPPKAEETPEADLAINSNSKEKEVALNESETNDKVDVLVSPTPTNDSESISTDIPKEETIPSNEDKESSATEIPLDSSQKESQDEINQSNVDENGIQVEKKADSTADPQEEIRATITEESPVDNEPSSTTEETRVENTPSSTTEETRVENTPSSTTEEQGQIKPSNSEDAVIESIQSHVDITQEGKETSNDEISKEPIRQEEKEKSEVVEDSNTKDETVLEDTTDMNDKTNPKNSSNSTKNVIERSSEEKKSKEVEDEQSIEADTGEVHTDATKINNDNDSSEVKPLVEADSNGETSITSNEMEIETKEPSSNESNSEKVIMGEKLESTSQDAENNESKISNADIETFEQKVENDADVPNTSIPSDTSPVNDDTATESISQEKEVVEMESKLEIGKTNNEEAESKNEDITSPIIDYSKESDMSIKTPENSEIQVQEELKNKESESKSTLNDTTNKGEEPINTQVPLDTSNSDVQSTGINVTDTSETKVESTIEISNETQDLTTNSKSDDSTSEKRVSVEETESKSESDQKINADTTPAEEKEVDTSTTASVEEKNDINLDSTKTNDENTPVVQNENQIVEEKKTD